jgi:hypothetical protein
MQGIVTMAHIFSKWYVHQCGSDTCDSAHDGCKFMKAYLDLQLRKIDRFALLFTNRKFVADNIRRGQLASPKVHVGSAALHACDIS